MTKTTGTRIGALAVLVAGIAIGYVASNGGFTGESVAQAPANAAVQATQNERETVANAQSEKAGDEIPVEWMPWRDPKNPNVIVLDPESNVSWRKRRDTSGDPKREPGVLNLQRYNYGLGTHGFPTYYNMPMALNSEDLKASDIDIAIFGSALDAQYLQGGKLTSVIGEIHKGGAIGFSVGGTHAQMYAWIIALAKEHGPGNFAMFHIDAHYDAQAPSNGIFCHNGAMIRVGVEQGLIKGEDVVTWGMRSPVSSAEELKWMRDNRHRYYTVAQLDKEGYEAVSQKVFKDLRGKKLFLSIDMDGINPGEAPAVGSSAVGGPSVSQAARMLRGLAMQCEIVGAEFGEYNPLLDDAHTTTGIAMDRLMRATMAGIAARKLGITDPNYNAPEALDDGVDN